MPRKKTDNETQIALRLPAYVLTRAEALVNSPAIASPGINTTRSDVLRVALLEGLTKLEESDAYYKSLHKKSSKGTK